MPPSLPYKLVQRQIAVCDRPAKEQAGMHGRFGSLVQVRPPVATASSPWRALATPPGYPGVHLGMQRVAQGAIENVRVRGDEDGAEIVAVGPVAFASELVLDASGKRCRGEDRKARRRCRPAACCGPVLLSLDLLPALAGIAELRK